jgi:hypothetical protein
MMLNGWRRVLAVLVMLAAPCAAVASGTAPASASGTAPAYWCVRSHSPWSAYRERRSPLPHKCNSGFIIARVPAGTTQLVTVGAKSYRTSWATLNTFVWTGGKWAHRRGPWTARIGQDGMATPGQKIEGDLLTPQGTYGFRFMFGVRANPGVLFSGATPTPTTTGTTTRPARCTTNGSTPATRTRAPTRSRCITSPSTTTRR